MRATSPFSVTELKLALRWMRKQPVTTATAIVALAVGIGLATLGTIVLEATTFATLPVDGGERFFRLRIFQEPGGEIALDAERLRAFREDASSFEVVGGIASATGNLRHDSGSIEPVSAIAVTAESFEAVPVTPILGRALLPDDETAGALPVVVLRESLWHRSFASDPEILGRSIEVSGVERTVVGVLPDSHEFPAGSELWIPLGRELLESGVGGLTTFGVLEPGIPVETAQAELGVLSESLARAGDPAVRVTLYPYTEPPEGWSVMITSLVAVLVLVLLVVAANVANLFAVRTATRSSELALRTALGAQRTRLIAQLFLEVAVLGVIAAGLGVTLAIFGLRQLDAAMGSELPFWIDLVPGPGSLAFVVAVTLLASAVAGVAPALRATRRDPALALRRDTPGGGRGLGRWSTAAVVAEVALSIALLSAAFVMARAFVTYTETGTGVPQPDRILTARLGETGEPTAADDAGTRKSRLLRAISGLPHVEAVGFGTSLPRVDPPDRPTLLPGPEEGESLGEPLALPVVEVDDGYFAALGVGAVEGRVFREQDLEGGAPGVAIVNRSFVDRVFGGTHPIGRRIALAGETVDGTPRWREIVGVVPDLRLSAADPRQGAGWYVPLPRTRANYYAAIRTASTTPIALEPDLRRAVAAVDAELALYRVTPLPRVGHEEEDFMTGFGSAMLFLGAMAMLLSLAGLYATMSLAVERRTREVGIRVALGASRRQVLRVLFGRAGGQLALGLFLGTILTRVLLEGRQLLVTRLPANEPWVVPLVLGLFALGGAAATWIPARRALGITPSRALRVD